MTELNRNPINTDVDNWHNTLFGRRFDPAAVGNVRDRFVALSLLSQHNNNDQTSITNTGKLIDVRFYCTVKRIGKNKEGQYINKDRNVIYTEGELSKPGGRFGNCLDITDPAMFVVLTVWDQYSEVQFCPWYLRSVRGFKFRDLADLPSSVYTSLSKILIPAAAKFKFTPIDVFVLTDKTIVHELTHIQQAYPATRDLQPTPYGELTSPSWLIVLGR